MLLKWKNWRIVAKAGDREKDFQNERFPEKMGDSLRKRETWNVWKWKKINCHDVYLEIHGKHFTLTGS